MPDRVSRLLSYDILSVQQVVSDPQHYYKGRNVFRSGMSSEIEKFRSAARTYPARAVSPWEPVVRMTNHHQSRVP